MGPHDTWFSLLPGYQRLEEFAGHYLSRHWTWVMFQETHFTLNHVAMMLIVVAFLFYAALRYRARATALRAAFSGPGGPAGASSDLLVPSPRFNLTNLLEMFLEGVLGMMSNIMGRDNARRYLPLVATLAFMIFFSNLLGLIPGFLPPTDTLKTNLALSLSVFVMTHVYGVQAHGVAYLKHFLGPKWYLAPLMLPIEIISNVARPASLALRLMGNIFADHKVVGAFFVLVPILVPLPFMVLGVLVSIVQTLVFSLLTTIYIALAVAHDDHGDEQHDDNHAQGHAHDPAVQHS
jgi:F-type H+-transporting ATPase subunit a